MDYLKVIKEQVDERVELDKRMGLDSDLLYLVKYVMKDSHNVVIPDVVNVTLNKPAIFAANVISTLGGTSQQTVVESEDKSIDTAEIEEFQKAAFNAANERLQRQGRPLLNPFADTQLCIRGRTARRVLFRLDTNGEVMPDIQVWDGRYIFYEMDENGLIWAAYRTTRSKRAIQAEYGVTVKGKTGEVTDCWDMEKNQLFIDGKIQVEQAHSWGFCPVVLEIVGLGYGGMLMDKNWLEHEGESIFFLIRDIIPELNRLVTILQTLNLKAVKAPVKYRSKDGHTATPPEYEDAMASGAVTSVDAEGDIALIDYGDAKRSAEMCYNIMEKQFQEGSITSIDLGNLQFPLSAVALMEVGEGRDRVFLPRLQSKALLNKATAEMFTRQVLKIGGTVEVGTPGHKRKFDTRKLEGEYSTSYVYTVKSPKTDVARLAQASAAEKYYDSETILERILHEEDPKEIMRKKYLQMAEVDFPIVRMHREVMAALKQAEEGDEDASREAKLMALQIGATIEKIKAGELPIKTTPPTETEPLVPLLGESGQVGGIKGAAKPAATPRGANA